MRYHIKYLIHKCSLLLKETTEKCFYSQFLLPHVCINWACVYVFLLNIPIGFFFFAFLSKSTSLIKTVYFNISTSEKMNNIFFQDYNELLLVP